MRYVIKQKWLAFGDDFTIADGSGQDRFLVDGKAFALGDKLVMKDMQGQEVARIEQKLLTLGTKYYVYRQDRQVASIKKKRFTLFRDVFDVEDAAAGDLDAQGDYFDHEYQFTRDGHPIATVSKRFFAWTDTYGVDVAEGEDDVLILAVAIVIDMCSHDKD